MEYCPLPTAARARWSAPARLRSFRAVKPTTELESFVTFGRMATASNSESTTEGRGVYPKDRFQVRIQWIDARPWRLYVRLAGHLPSGAFRRPRNEEGEKAYNGNT